MPGAVVFGWASTTAGHLPGGGSWPAAVEPGGAYCAATRLDLADCGPGPALLMAWTVNRQLPACSVIVSPRAEPGCTADFVVATTVPVADIRSARTRYPVTADPPSLAGGFQAAVAVTAPPAVPAAAGAITGAPGTVAGTTTADSAESGPAPAALAAATWNR